LLKLAAVYRCEDGAAEGKVNLAGASDLMQSFSAGHTIRECGVREGRDTRFGRASFLGAAVDGALRDNGLRHMGLGAADRGAGAPGGTLAQNAGQLGCENGCVRVIGNWGRVRLSGLNSRRTGRDPGMSDLCF